MFCVKCGNYVDEKSKFCTQFGERVINFNEERNNVNVNPISSNNYGTTSAVKNDKPSVILTILSFFIPILGLVLFIVYRDKSPKKAKFVGISALIGFILGIIASIALIIFFSFYIITSDDRYNYNDNSNYNYYEDYFNNFEDMDDLYKFFNEDIQNNNIGNL